MTCRLEDLLKIIKGDFACKLNGQRIDKSNMNTESYCDHKVVSIEIENGTFLIELKPFESVTPKCNTEEVWVKNHRSQFRTEPSFF